MLAPGVRMARSAAWTCPTCSKNRRLRFCPQCGEERLREGDLSMRDMAAQFAKKTTSVDGKLVRSLLTLAARPGQLTASYIKGERHQTISPLALFFIGNAIFVGVQSLTGVNILSSPLESHLHSQDWSSFAQDLVRTRLEHRNLTIEAYSPVFDRAALLNAKTLIILMALVFAPLPALLYRRACRTAGAHMIFALHLYAFILILLSVSVLLAQLEMVLGGEGLRSGIVDTVLSIFNLIVCGGYIYLALQRVYSTSGWRRVSATLFLTAAVGLLFVGYRFAIFLISFYAT
jgi:hypothetical protein